MLIQKKFWVIPLVLCTIIFDQWSKLWILQSFILYEKKAIFPWLNFLLVYNTGSAFSFLSNTGAWHQWFFIIFSLTMSIILLVWIWRLPRTQHTQLLAVGLILGGAIGNLVDRLYLGYVVDFIQVYYKNFYWPVFNLADSAICLGVGILILDAFLNRPPHRQT